MADTGKRIGPTQLTNSAVTQYTVPSATTFHLRDIEVANTTGSDRTVTLSIGADAAGTRLLPGLTVKANGLLQWQGYVALAATEIIQAYADSGSALTLTISGVEET